MLEYSFWWRNYSQGQLSLIKAVVKKENQIQNYIRQTALSVYGQYWKTMHEKKKTTQPFIWK